MVHLPTPTRPAPLQTSLPDLPEHRRDRLATTLLADLPDARVWIDTLRPGQHGPAHGHDRPYTVLAVTAGRVKLIHPTTEQALEEHDLTPGQVFRPEHGGDGWHVLVNAGPYDVVLVTVEYLS